MCHSLLTPDDLRKPDECVECAGTSIRLICYGLPTDETLRRAQCDEIVLGGCTIVDDMPDWRCMDCGHEWFDPSDPVRIERDRLMAEIERDHRKQLGERQSGGES